MYGEIAAILVSFVSFVPFVFKTCTRVWRSYLQTRSYCQKLQKVAVWYIYHRGIRSIAEGRTQRAQEFHDCVIAISIENPESF